MLEPTEWLVCSEPLERWFGGGIRVDPCVGLSGCTSGRTETVEDWRLD